MRPYLASIALHLCTLIDSKVHPILHDLASVLQRCLDLSPGIAFDPAYIQLYGPRRKWKA
jgi:hypothetical protein